MNFYKHALGICLLFVSVAAAADTNLVMVCRATVAEGAVLEAATGKCTSRAWAKPEVNSMVASCLAANCGSWAGAGSAWRRFGSLPATARVLYCTADIAPGTAIAATDPCPAASKPFPWLSLQPPDTGQAVVGWKAPTVSTTDKPLGNALLGYRIYAGSSPDKLSKVGEVPADTFSFAVTGLAVGMWYFAATAFTASGESLMSAVVSKDIVPAAVIPRNPTDVTVAMK